MQRVRAPLNSNEADSKTQRKWSVADFEQLDQLGTGRFASVRPVLSWQTCAELSSAGNASGAPWRCDVHCCHLVEHPRGTVRKTQPSGAALSYASLQVYRSIERSTGKHVAIKVCKPAPCNRMSSSGMTSDMPSTTCRQVFKLHTVPLSGNVL
jgi:hypothetical protein